MILIQFIISKWKGVKRGEVKISVQFALTGNRDAL